MDIPGLDPVYQGNNWEYASAINLYDSLVWPDAEKGVKPWVAESWQVSDDAKTYTFKIRKGLQFHDGSELTAEDVAFSMTRMLTLNGPAAANFRTLKADGVKLVDAGTVSFTLAVPDSAFVKALLTFKIVNKKLVLANLADGTYGEFKDYGKAFLQHNDAGSGPYKVSVHKPGELLRMVRFDAYSLTPWNSDAPATVEFQITPEMATVGTKLRAKEIDIGDWSLPVSVQRQIASDGRFRSQEDAQSTAWFVVMNNAKPPLDDVNVRRAVASAYDSGTVVKHILGGGGPLAGPVPGAMLPGCEGIPTYPFSLEKAKEYLAKSKYSAADLAKFKLEVAAVAGSERFNNIALSLATNLKKIGLPTDVKAVRWADIGQAQTKPETAYNFVVFYDGAKVPDPNVFLTYYTKKGWGDAFPPGGIYYDNPGVTKLVEEGIHSTDTAVQQKVYCEAVKQIAADSPSIFSHTDVRQTTYWNYVKAYGDGGGALFYDLRFENWRIDPNSPDLKK
ncbi:ABC transporter substrate-binding protein [Agrobacterium tumefaciens]|uniref:ABC transporter substrate-binding protein n=1 Tax=Agrobacterium tumefaciens TaxID=358 RepID=UPI0021FDE512|nr:ABC transporter substrate-binding protein [Agrobacterium tumefaciens]